MAGIAMLLSSNQLFTQVNLNWASSFTPVWNNGDLSHTATNIGGNSINCTATISMHSPGGSFGKSNGASGSQTPTVSGAIFVVPSSSSCIQVTPDYNQKTGYSNTILIFSALTTSVSFRVVDIDKAAPTDYSYFDRVTITGTNGSTTFNPLITKFDPLTDPNFLIISGNTAYVNPASGQADNAISDLTDQRGTINVNFGTAIINSITIRIDNAPGTDNNPGAQSIAIGALSFSQSVLPVTLTNFSGHRQQQDVLLNWSTSQEFNSALFEIERSNGSSSWEKIGFVTASGNSSTYVDYSFRDVNPQGSLLLYRLKQIDIDNKFKYSSVVRITTKNAASDLQLYPNPARDHASINIYSAGQQQASFYILDAMGRTVRTETRKLFTGENNIMLSKFAAIHKGIYHIVVYDESGSMMGRTKVVKE